MIKGKNSQWPPMSRDSIRARVFDALDQNVDFRSNSILGVPASHLDEKVFYSNAPFLADAPFLSALVSNPNHIGCHTLGHSEPFFSGTHRIERELVQLCAQQILGAEEECDGYVAAGGTEANIQAAWIYRNHFMREFGAASTEISILCSSDSHYSAYKAANLLNIGCTVVDVHPDTRRVEGHALEAALMQAEAEGRRYFIVFVNMMTTMFGAVDQVNDYTEMLKRHHYPFKVHVDGAYGGFFLPFTEAVKLPDFTHPEVSSVTLDAHKMVQAPYGTGLFLVRKGWMKYAGTPEASYVAGADSTLGGSRSGANAIAVWMILMTYGRKGWEAKVRDLVRRSDRFCEALDRLGVRYYRADQSNIVTLKAGQFDPELAPQFGLVPDNHTAPNWWKVVVMEHVTTPRLDALVSAIEQALTVRS